MTQEDKELLLKDLCERLPYGVKGHYKYYDIVGGRECLTDENDGNITSIDTVLGNPIKINGYYTEVEYVKPYLRPMSSMTEEEKNNYHKAFDTDLEKVAENIKNRIVDGTFGPDNLATPKYYHIDWLNLHHFDYRGLIEKGLALEAPEGMYKTE